MRWAFLTLTSAAILTGCASDKGLIVYNTAPQVTIISPIESSEFFQGETIQFLGKITDDGEVEKSEVTWGSSIDGVIPDVDPPDTDGNVEVATASLSPGDHVITLSVIDDDGGQGEAQVTITVSDQPDLPSIEVVHPDVGELGLEDFPFTFQATVSDTQDAPEDLVASLTANPTGKVCDLQIDGSGNAACSEILPVGIYTLTFKVTDTNGNEATATASFEVVDKDNFDADGDSFTPNEGDCDDNNGNICPGCPEICDGLDNDCNTLTAMEVGTECYDDDGDGFCEAPPCVNTTETLADCDDTSADAYPGVGDENPIPNGIDDDCDTFIDEETDVFDDDGDCYCEAGTCTGSVNTACTSVDPGDCNDGNTDQHPNNPDETCNDGIDSDCSGDDGGLDAIGCTNFFEDQDGDTYGLNGPQQCYCNSGEWPWTGVNNQDCDDNNANVWPGQPAWFTASRANGSFDYNCDGSDELRYVGSTSGCASSTISCDVNTPGWDGPTPQCGQPGLWLNDCDEDWVAFLLTCGLCTFSCIVTDSQSCINCIQSNCPNGMVCEPPEYDPSISQQQCH